MSTDILNDESPGFNGVYLNEFWGGTSGRCHQITIAGHGPYVQLTTAQMQRLVDAWLDYVKVSSNG